MILLLLCLVLVLGVLVLYLNQVNSTFNQHGIKHITPIPLLGNMAKIVMRRDNFAYSFLNLYNSFPEERFVGRFEFLTEVIVIRDVELVKKITVKDFEHFIDHRTFEGESFFNRTLFTMKGQEWKDMRSTLSPAFTSSKIRLMIPFMEEVGDQMIRSLKKKLADSKDDYIDIDIKELTTRYANDVIASCAYGLKVDSHTDENNEFYAMGKALFDFNFRKLIMFFVLLNLPKVAKILNWDIVPDVVKKFFTNLVLDTMKKRETHNIIRPDMIHLLMESRKVTNKLYSLAKKLLKLENTRKLSHDDVKSDEAAGFATVEESSFGKKEINKAWNDSDIIAQVFLFFVAGFETVSTGMSFLMHELAVNPDVQERLAQEIREHDAKSSGKFDFNSIQSMTYLDMVVSELLRLWPPNLIMERQCNKDYNMGKPNKAAKNDFILLKGAGIMMPTFAFHRDPQYFPEPENFDPERFSEENKHKINPLAYTPFGAGPRNCIGSRFALCELKVMTYQLLRLIELSPCEKTRIPAKLANDNLNIRLQGGHWLRLRLRK